MEYSSEFNAKLKVGIAKALKQQRLDRKYTQSDLARLVGVDVKTVRLWESGLSDGPAAFHLDLMDDAGFDILRLIAGGERLVSINDLIVNFGEQTKYPRNFIETMLLDYANFIAGLARGESYRAREPRQ